MFDSQKEKDKIYEMLSSTKVEENHFNKQELAERAISIAMDEYEELAYSFNDFFNSISHLVIYQKEMNEALQQFVSQFMNNTRNLIQRNYSKEELESLPSDLYDHVLESQQRRSELLKEIINTYINNQN